jgi:DNA-binding response OmpR family regulator
MRIVLYNDRQTEREAMVRTMASIRNVTVEAYGDEAEAHAAILGESPQLMVVAVSARGGAEVVQRFRGSDVSGQAYLLAVFDAGMPSKEIPTLIAAGANDFMRRPVLESELIERVRAPERLLWWARNVGQPTLFGIDPPREVTGLQAWRNLGPLVATDFAQIAGRPVNAVEGWPASYSADLRCATVAMTMTQTQVEVRLSVVVDSAAQLWLKNEVLREPAATLGAIDDAVRELANTAGGCFKRPALAEGMVLTTGLPLTAPAPTREETINCWTLSIENSSVTMLLTCQVRRRGNQRLPASELTEGMVLLNDLRSRNGVLLASAGSRLTETTAAKLSQVLGARFYLDVSPGS